MKKYLIIGIAILFLSGCATISRVTDLKGQPPTTDLFPDDEDIARVIKEIKEKPAPSVSAVKWTGEGYLVTPEAYEKILNDAIYLKALKKKIEKFAEDYTPETLASAWRKDMGTAMITILIMLGIMVY